MAAREFEFEDPLGAARVLVRNGWHGRPPAPPTPQSLWARALYHNPLYRTGTVVLVCAYLLLAVWENPTTKFVAAAWPLHVAECFCLVFLAGDLWLQWVYFGQEMFWTKRCVGVSKLL
jgi:hypothetical protein